MEQAKNCPHQCDCFCHEEGNHAMHIMPCCGGKCEICGKHIKFGKIEEHLRDCHPEPIK